MARRCEICDKGVVAGVQYSHSHRQSQGIIAFIAAYILSIVFFNDISASSIKHTYFNSNYLFIILLLILLLPFVINKLFKLFKTS